MSRGASPADSGTRLLARVRALAFPRFPGGAEEARVADLLAEEFRAAGLTVRREPFTAGRTALARLRALVQIGFAVGIGLVARMLRAEPTLVWPAALALLALGSSAGRWRLSFERLFDDEPLVESANVAGTRAPRGRGAAEAAAAGGPHLVFLAHLDSKSTRLPTFWPAAAALAALAWLVLAAGWSGAVVLRGGDVPVAIALIGYAVAVALAAVTWNPLGNESPGAMDNASGLAVLGELARVLPADPALADARLTFVATGAEELGMAGAMRWIAAHERALDPAVTVFVNVDSVGVGRGLLALDTHGFAPDGRSVADHVRTAAREADVRVRLVPFLPGVGVDTMPIAARGFATVTLVGEVLGSASRRIHTREDTVEHLDPDALAAVARLVHALARRLAGPTVTDTEPVTDRKPRPAVAARPAAPAAPGS